LAVDLKPDGGHRGTAKDRPTSGRWLLSAATGATLLLPVALLYARAIGDGALTLIGVLLLVRSAIDRDWGWLQAPWTRLMLLFWGWMLLCTVLAGTGPAVLQALLALRFYLFVAALDYWVLGDLQTRRRLWYVVLAVALWILVEVWQQYLLGTNLFGYQRWADGALTGPFSGPVAGSMYLAVFFAAFMPLCFLLVRRPDRASRVLGVAVPVFAAATMILIGQRMPAMLMALGLCASGLLFRQMRVPVVLTVVVCVVVLAALPVVSPPTFAKLVVRFSDQMQHFWDTPYGMILGRAVTMIQAHPWIGLGWDGYRNGCMQPAYLNGVSWLPVGDPANELGCNIHPHNYWLQVGTSAGLPGIALFGALATAWLWRIGFGAGAGTNDRRAGVVVAVFVAMWPIASATSLFTVPNAGWIFLMIGWGLAEVRWS
jgi:O-antigen ligase